MPTTVLRGHRPSQERACSGCIGGLCVSTREGGARRGSILGTWLDLPCQQECSSSRWTLLDLDVAAAFPRAHTGRRKACNAINQQSASPYMGPALALLCMHAACALAAPENRSFDIVYINLERHRDKRAHVERMLLHAGCSFSRFNAVDGRELCSQRRSILDYTEGTHIVPTDDTIRERIDAGNAARAGCHLSHLIVLRRIGASGAARPVLVLEDDVDLDTRFVKKVEDVIANPPGRWDVILLGGIVKEKWWPCRRSRQLVEVRYQACTHAYLLSGAESAGRIADVIDTSRCPGRPVDLLIGSAFRDDADFVFYCFSPMIAVQRRDLFDSDITVQHKRPFYARYLASMFQSAYLRPLQSSLAAASSPKKAGTESATAHCHAPLILLLFLVSCVAV